jgi:hypothetical protein
MKFRFPKLEKQLEPIQSSMTAGAVLPVNQTDVNEEMTYMDSVRAYARNPDNIQELTSDAKT